MRAAAPRSSLSGAKCMRRTARPGWTSLASTSGPPATWRRAVSPVTADVQTRARQLLAGLGADRDQVAAGLRRAGITGSPEDCQHCPVARFLMRELPEVLEAAVG